MSNEFDIFVLYYNEWHEGGFSLIEMKQEIIAEISKEGLTKALHELKVLNAIRLEAGDNTTYYDYQKFVEKAC